MTSSRKPWLAALLTLIAPGLGHFYAGRSKAALVFAIASQAVAWAVLSAWVWLTPSTLIVFFGFLSLLGVLSTGVLHAAIAAHQAGSTYELRSYNRWYIYLAAFVILTLWHRASFLLAQSTLAQAYRIPSPTMEPALLVGDYVYVAKQPPSLLTPQHEAIVVFVSIEDSTPSLHIVKRVVGTPGDTLRMVRDTVYRNGRRLNEPYVVRLLTEIADDPARLQQIRAWQVEHYVGRDLAGYQPTTHDWGPIVVPPEHCFVMGDNRAQSYDSRYYGFVPFDHVRGRPRFVYYSYDAHAGAVRWARIGRAIP
jgi:signal peptidase I